MDTCLVLFYLFSGISTCSGYLELNSSRALFYLSLSGNQSGHCGLNQEIWNFLVISMEYYESILEFNWDTLTEMGLVCLVSSWSHLLGTLLVRVSLRQSVVWSGDWKIDRSGVIWYLYLLGDLWEIYQNIVIVRFFLLSPLGSLPFDIGSTKHSPNT